MPEQTSLITKENITFLLAVFGSIGTLITFITSIIHNSVKIKLELIEISCKKDSVLAYIMFTNFSHLPVSITDVTIKHHGIVYSCKHTPETVGFYSRHRGSTEVYQEAIKSLALPISLSSLSGTSGYLYFVIPQRNFECLSNQLTVEVSTNRHRKVRKKLLLPSTVSDV